MLQSDFLPKNVIYLSDCPTGADFAHWLGGYVSNPAHPAVVAIVPYERDGFTLSYTILTQTK